MKNNPYVQFDDESDRVFINPTLGCESSCTYCYLPEQDFLKIDGKVVPANVLYSEMANDKRFNSGETLVSIGCFTDGFAHRVVGETVKFAKLAMQHGNLIQAATKQYVDSATANELRNAQQYESQFQLNVGCSVVTNNEKIEVNTAPLSQRWKNFEHDLIVNLLIKPYLEGLTGKDVDLFIDVIKKYGINDVVVGSEYRKNATGKPKSFLGNQFSIHDCKERHDFIQKLKSHCRVFAGGAEQIKEFQKT